MTTSAKLKSKLPTDGHGLSPRLCDAIYDARAKGQPTEDLLVVGRITPIGHGEENGKRFVTFDIAQFEIASQHPDTTHVVDIITAASDKRHGGQQLAANFEALADDEQRRHLLGLVDEWATEEGLTPTEVAERWRTQWGIDSDEPSTDGAFAHPDINKAAVHHIKEFAYMVGVLADAPEAARADQAPVDEDDDVAGTAEDDEAAAS